MFSAGSVLQTCLDEPQLPAAEKHNRQAHCLVTLCLLSAFCLLEHGLNEDKEWTYAGTPLLFQIVYPNFQVGEADYLLLTEGLCWELVLTGSNCVIRRV